MHITSLGSRRTALAAVTTLSLAAASLALATTASASAASFTLSSLTGPSTGGNALTVTNTGTDGTFISGLAVELQYKAAASIGTATCSNAYLAQTSVTNVLTTTSGILNVTGSTHILSAKKLAFTVPTPGGTSTLLTPAASPLTTAGYLVCVYTSNSLTGTNLIGPGAAYLVAASPTINTAACLSPADATHNLCPTAPAVFVPGVVPTSGSAMGGGAIKITGTNLVAGTTAKIGSVPVTVTSIVGGTTLLGTVPPQAAASGLSVSVTNVGGTATLNGAYTYSNGITVSPNTAPSASTTNTDVDVQGVGFNALTFTTTNGSDLKQADAHVYLVDGIYSAVAGSAPILKAKGALGECENVLPISDTELICTIDTNTGIVDPDTEAVSASAALIPEGTYTLTVVSKGAVGAAAASPLTYSQSIVSSGSTFTVAAY